MKKVVSVVGARPNFIKLAALNAILIKTFRHIIIHTGQHYDYEMSQKFFDEFSVPAPNYNLHVGSHSPKEQIKLITTKCERVLKSEKPDIVIVYGDTNSTVAGAKASKKACIPIAHIEAGVRSFDKKIPEENNRIMVDSISDILLCPSEKAVENLKEENYKNNIYYAGDVMYDIFLKTKPDFSIIKNNKIQGKYYFATIHRQENTNSKIRLTAIIESLNALDLQTVIPLHPRTEKALKNLNLKTDNIKFIQPVKYSQSIALQKYSQAVITDSGGIQKEAYWLKVPCITLRNSTEWPETVLSGWNKLTGVNRNLIQNGVTSFKKPLNHPYFYGRGQASVKITKIIQNYL